MTKLINKSTCDKQELLRWYETTVEVDTPIRNQAKKDCNEKWLRSRATVSLFHKFDVTNSRRDEENGTRKTLLFTISNSWPISFGKHSF